MTQELQIKATLVDIENRTDKNNNPYLRLSLQGIYGRYYYAFNNLKKEIFTSLTNFPHKFVNRQVLVTYQELPNRDNLGTFYRVKDLQIT